MDVVLGVFVFFKQKTAYELRISDWSSDVCSSDLLVRVDEAVARDGESGSGVRRCLGELRCAQVDAERRQEIALADRPMGGAAEIGRASCRERVCQYV